MTTTTGLSYGAAPNHEIHADNGINYAYREIGTGTVALVLSQHFRGNLENWDPRLVEPKASSESCPHAWNADTGAST